MEQNYNNNYNNSNNYNSNYDNYGNNYNYSAQPPVVDAVPVKQQPQRKRNGKLGKAIAIIAAVAIVGGGAGFGGAFLAGKVIETASAPANSGTVTASYDLDNNKDNGETAPSGDVSSALNAISDNTDGKTAEKLFPTSVTPTGANGAYTTEELYEAVNDTIVLIKVYKENTYSGYDYYDYFFGYDDRYSEKQSDEPEYAGYGSGIVFTEDGYILTNAHVVKDAAKLVVEVNDYYDKDLTYEYEAKVIGSDDSSDIAVIKIERADKFVAAKIGDSDSLKVGQSIAVIGNPGVNADIMFTHTMTTGVISGLDVECLADNGYSLSLIQTDAAINSGNSGGGMFDMYGNVIGVVNSKIVATTYEGLGFALTINEAKPIMQDLLSYGYVKSRPVLGISTVELNEYRAQLYGVKLSQGLLVSGLNEGAPVEKSGLQVSDIITKINGKNVSKVTDVQQIISKFKVGDTVTATVARVNATGGVDSVEIQIELTESGSSK